MLKKSFKGKGESTDKAGTCDPSKQANKEVATVQKHIEAVAPGFLLLDQPLLKWSSILLNTRIPLSGCT